MIPMLEPRLHFPGVSDAASVSVFCSSKALTPFSHYLFIQWNYGCGMEHHDPC
jgi:hypothetical protein